jgi:hypothetical protein
MMWGWIRGGTFFREELDSDWKIEKLENWKIEKFEVNFPIHPLVDCYYYRSHARMFATLNVEC